MDFKFDIRILALSLLIHLSVFGLLSFYTSQNKKLIPETIEVVIDDSPARILLPNQSKNEEKKEEENTDKKDSHFVSDRTATFKKESIAQNEADYLKNKTTKNAKQNSRPLDLPKNPLEESNSPDFVPVAQDKSTKDERQSTVNFQVPNLARGELTFLNSDFYTYASFYNRITPKIMYNWGNNIDDIAMFPHMREKLRRKLRWVTKLEMILDRLGHFKNITIINSSGSEELDQAIVHALRDAGPYLNPPTGMIEKDGTVHILGEFTIYTQRPRLAY